MIFKAVEIKDKAILESWLSKYGVAHCSTSVVELICGNTRYRHEWCIHEGFFVLHFISDDNESVYLQPIGEGKLEIIIQAIEKDAKDRGVPPVILDATPAFVSQMSNLFPLWKFAADRKYADYVYDIDDLKSLKGRKYRSKRHDVQKFYSNYDFKYVDLKPSMFDECVELEKKWMSRKMEDCSVVSAEELRKDLSDEYSFIEEAFKYYDNLELIGGALYVENRLVAFTFGSSLNCDTLCIHIEKADTDYLGVFAAIYHQFVLHLPECFKYVNAEWDNGIPGLRQSKLEYHPVCLLESITGRKEICPPVTVSSQDR